MTQFVISPRETQNIVIQSSFRPFGDFHGYMSDNAGVDVDWHEYQCFGQYWNHLADEADKGWPIHLNAAYAWGDDNRTLPIFAGEWSLGITTCQQYLCF